MGKGLALSNKVYQSSGMTQSRVRGVKFKQSIKVTNCTYIGPRPISKKDTNEITKKRDAILFKYPSRHITRITDDTNIPPADQSIN